MHPDFQMPAAPGLMSPDRNGSAVHAENSGADEWLLWQLTDSAFPTGGFAHSGGLEAAYQQGEVQTVEDVETFIRASLVQTGRATLPFALATYDEPERAREIDALCDAFITNHVANRASRLQGQALFASAGRIFGRSKLEAGECLEFRHLATVFGVTTRALSLDRNQSARLFIFWQLRGWLASAVRLGLVGPIEAQTIQFRSRSFNENIVKRFMCLGLMDIAQSAPLLDLLQGMQDRLYSRLFQS